MEIKYLIILIFIMSFSVMAVCNVGDLKTNTIAYYELEENSVNYTDSSPNNIHLNNANNDPIRTNGIIGYGQNFTGTHRLYSEIRTELEQDPISICQWYNINVLGGTNQQLLGLRWNTYGFNNFVKGTDDDNNAFYYVVGGTNSYSTDVSISENIWYYRCTVFNTDPWIYINAVNITGGTRTSSGNNINYNSGTHKVVIGDTYNSGWSSQVLNGVIDEVLIYNGTLSEDCITYLYAGGTPGIDQQYPFLSDTQPPYINVTFPIVNNNYNNGNWNRSIHIQANETIIRCDINISGYDEYTPSATQWVFNRTTMADGNYSLFINCTDSSGNEGNYTGSWIVYDNVNPTITISHPINNTEYKTTDINISVLFYDYYLWKTNTTIYNSSGNVFYNNYSNELGGFNTTYIASGSINLNDGFYTMFSEAADTHTKKEFKEIPQITETINGSDKNTKYKFKKADIEFITSSDTTINTYKTFDRLKQEFVSTNHNSNKKLTIKGTNIKYQPISNYDCHLIINDYYWWDCEGMEIKDFKVKPNGNIEIKYNHNKDSIMTESLGGLNYINKTIIFEINTSAPYIPPNVTNGTTSIITGTEITIKFGNVNIIVGLLLTFILFMLTAYTKNDIFFLLSLFSGLLLCLSIQLYSTELLGMYKLLIWGIYIIAMWGLRKNWN